jgi:hypothetical protein
VVPLHQTRSAQDFFWPYPTGLEFFLTDEQKANLAVCDPWNWQKHIESSSK